MRSGFGYLRKTVSSLAVQSNKYCRSFSSSDRHVWLFTVYIKKIIFFYINNLISCLKGAKQATGLKQFKIPNQNL